MIAAKQSVEDLGGVIQTPVVFFANHVGVTFRDDDPIAKNEAILNVLKAVDDTVKEQGTTSFSLGHHELGHFLHLAYCKCPEGNKIVVDFNGIFPFKAEDEKGVEQLYNAQLITISEQPDD